MRTRNIHLVNLAVLTSVFVSLLGCGGGGGGGSTTSGAYVGTWKRLTMQGPAQYAPTPTTCPGETVIDAAGDHDSCGSDDLLVFNSNGTVQYTPSSSNGSPAFTGTYSASGNTLNLTITQSGQSQSANASATWSVSGTTLTTVTVSGPGPAGETITYAKQ